MKRNARAPWWKRPEKDYPGGHITPQVLRSIFHKDTAPGIASKVLELPFTIGVVSHLSGTAPRPPRTPELREFRTVTKESLRNLLEEIEPRIAFEVPNVLDESFGSVLKVDLRISSMEDFEPAGIVRQTPLLVEAWSSGALRDASLSNVHVKRAQQLRYILHHQDFQRVEAAWRGLEFLLSSIEQTPWVIVKVLDISEKELTQMSRDYPQHEIIRCPLFKLIQSDPYAADVLDPEFAQPFTVLLADYYFDHSPASVYRLRTLATIAASAHTPCVAGAAPSLLGSSSWQKLKENREFARAFRTVERAAYRSFRRDPDSSFIALAMPRLLGRLPYGGPGCLRTDLPEFFEVDPTRDPADPRDVLWVNPAYPVIANIARAYTSDAWCAAIQGVEAGGRLEGLKRFARTASQSNTRSGVPLETVISYAEVAELAELGLIAICSEHQGDAPVIMSARTLFEPQRYAGPAAEEANLAESCRALLRSGLMLGYFLHRFRLWLGMMNQLGLSRHDLPSLEHHLQELLHLWILDSPNSAASLPRSQRPLSHGRVRVLPIEGNPGVFNLVLEITPHFRCNPTSPPIRGGLVFQ